MDKRPVRIGVSGAGDLIDTKRFGIRFFPLYSGRRFGVEGSWRSGACGNDFTLLSILFPRGDDV
jgi:hypothetical protein